MTMPQNGGCNTHSLTTALQDGLVEDKVQVQRRRLEQMIVDSITVEGQSYKADTFFDNVARDCCVSVFWPTRLKIGAKTKKDPFIKLVGTPDRIEVARTRILHVLERKLRVTLKMDVSFCDHSHIIGRQGKNTQAIMRDTGCHIHFPDSNRSPDLPKSNQVSIAGLLSQVEQARAAVRQLSPVSVSIELTHYLNGITAEGVMESAAVEQVMETYRVQVLVRENASTYLPYLVVKGCAHQQSEICAAVKMLFASLLRSELVKPRVCLGLEILPHTLPFVMGEAGAHATAVSNATGADIRLPSQTGTSSVYIFGDVSAVLTARQYILGLLPFSLCFEVPSTGSLCSDNVARLQQQFGVSVTAKNGTQLHIRGHECQANSLYAVRRELVRGEGEKVALCNEYIFMNHFPLSSCSAEEVSTPILPVSPIPDEDTSNRPTRKAVPPPLKLAPASSIEQVQPSPGPITPTVYKYPPETAPAAPVITLSVCRDPHPCQDPVAASLLSSAVSIQQQEAERKVVGSGRHNVSEYKLMAVKATKAMQESPRGVRIPNTKFSGYFFSRSMPAAELQRLRQQQQQKLLQRDIGEEVVQQEQEITQPASLAAFNPSETSYFDSLQSAQETNVARPFPVESADISMLLSFLDLNGCFRIFESEEVDMDALLKLSEDDLKDLGVKFLARRKLKCAIQRINQARICGEKYIYL